MKIYNLFVYSELLKQYIDSSIYKREISNLTGINSLWETPVEWKAQETDMENYSQKHPYLAFELAIEYTDTSNSSVKYYNSENIINLINKDILV